MAINHLHSSSDATSLYVVVTSGTIYSLSTCADYWMSGGRVEAEERVEARMMKETQVKRILTQVVLVTACSSCQVEVKSPGTE